MVRAAAGTLAATMLAVSTTWALFSQEPGTQQPVTVSAPSPSGVMQGYAFPAALSTLDGSGRIEVHTLDKQVVLVWVYKQPDGVVKTKPHKVPVEFWPTAAAAVGDELFVAGKTCDRGITTIRRWAFDFANFPAELQGIEKSSVYAAQAEGKSDLRWMERIHVAAPSAPHLLCQFGDSMDLGTFDVTAGTLTTAVATESFPALESKAHQSVWSGTHQEHGWFCVMQRGLPGPSFDPIVVFDLDRDGDLDVWLQCQDRAQWDALMGDPDVDFVID